MANRAAEEDGDDGESQEEQGVQGGENEESGGGGRVEEGKGEEGVEGCKGGLNVELVSCWLICGNGKVVGTYHCQSAYDLTRRVDIAGHELADEVCCHTDNGDHGDDTEATGDKEGPCERGGGGHICLRFVWCLGVSWTLL